MAKSELSRKARLENASSLVKTLGKIYNDNRGKEFTLPKERNVGGGDPNMKVMLTLDIYQALAREIVRRADTGEDTQEVIAKPGEISDKMDADERKAILEAKTAYNRHTQEMNKAKLAVRIFADQLGFKEPLPRFVSQRGRGAGGAVKDAEINVDDFLGDLMKGKK